MHVDYMELLVNIILASFGGLVKRMSDTEKVSAAVPTLSYYMVGCFTSMFVGLIVYFLCKNFSVPHFLTDVATSVAGYTGTSILDILSDLLVTRIKKAGDGK